MGKQQRWLAAGVLGLAALALAALGAAHAQGTLHAKGGAVKVRL